MLPQADLVKLNEIELEVISDCGLRIADLGLGTEKFESVDPKIRIPRSPNRCAAFWHGGRSVCVVTFGPNGSYVQTKEWARVRAALPGAGGGRLGMR